MDIALVLDRLLPAAIYSGSLTDNTETAFNALSWNDERTKPSWQAILDEWDVYTKTSLFAYLATYRYNKEVGGMSFYGLPVPTDDRTKTLLVVAYNAALEENDPNRLRQFKVEGAFATLNNSYVIAIALAVADHVQKCFDSESSTAALINNNTLTTTAEIEDAFNAAYSG